jgi:hypothetical protein
MEPHNNLKILSVSITNSVQKPFVLTRPSPYWKHQTGSECRWRDVLASMTAFAFAAVVE